MLYLARDMNANFEKLKNIFKNTQNIYSNFVDDLIILSSPEGRNLDENFDEAEFEEMT